MRAIRRLCWLPIALAPGPAAAHAPVPGIEGFYIGLIHPFSTPSQALLMVGLGLVVGSFAVDKVAPLLGAFLVFSFVGLFAGSADWNFETPMFVVAFLACALAALLPGKLQSVAIVFCAIAGFLVGSTSIPDAGPVRDRVATMTGSMVGANVGLLYIFGVMLVINERFTWPGVRVAFRILAAWLGAIALVMLALAYADPQPVL